MLRPYHRDPAWYPRVYPVRQRGRQVVSKPIVLCDVDDVAAEFIPAWARRINEALGTNLTASSFVSWDLREFLTADQVATAYRLLGEKNFYDDVAPANRSLWGITRLRDIARVVFVTSSNTALMKGKVNWLERWGFLPNLPRHSDLIMAHDKSMIRGDLLIDDGPHNVAAFSGPTILFDQPHNRNVDHPNRATDWFEVVSIAERLLS